MSKSTNTKDRLKLKILLAHLPLEAVDVARIEKLVDKDRQQLIQRIKEKRVVVIQDKNGADNEWFEAVPVEILETMEKE